MLMRQVLNVCWLLLSFYYIQVSALDCYTCAQYDSDDLNSEAIHNINEHQRRLGYPSCTTPVLKKCDTPRQLLAKLNRLSSSQGTGVDRLINIIKKFGSDGIMKCIHVKTKTTVTIFNPQYRSASVDGETRGCQVVPKGTTPGCRSDGPIMKLVKELSGQVSRIGTSIDIKGTVCVCDTKDCCNEGQLPIGKNCPAVALIAGLSAGAGLLIMLIVIIAVVKYKSNKRRAATGSANFVKQAYY